LHRFSEVQCLLLERRSALQTATAAVRRIRSWLCVRSRTQRHGGGCHLFNVTTEMGTHSLAPAVTVAVVMSVSEWVMPVA